MPYIYKITNKINGKIYIGKTMFSVEKRWKEHSLEFSKERNEKRPLYLAMKKYGIDNFCIEQVEECEESILSEREKYWIESYGSYKNGYNATIGGDGKPYIDRKLVIDLYEKYKNIKTVSEIMNVNYFSVMNILHEKNVDVIPHYTNGVAVLMIDRLTDEPLKSFSSYKDAAIYLIDNGLSKCGLSGLSSHIADVCKGKRKTVANYKWCAVN